MKTKTPQPTPFEIAQKQVKEGTLQAPTVTSQGKDVPYFLYQLACHKMELSLMTKGMKLSRHSHSLKQLKDYYGLKGRTAADCMPQFEKIMADYKAELEKGN